MADTETSMTSDLNEFARFVVPLQARPESHIPMTATEELGIVKDLEEFETELFVERGESGAIEGAAGFDYDEPLKRGFLYGPWSIEDGWEERSQRLLARILAAAPSPAKDLETAFDKQNLRA